MHKSLTLYVWLNDLNNNLSILPLLNTNKLASSDWNIEERKECFEVIVFSNDSSIGKENACVVPHDNALRYFNCDLCIVEVGAFGEIVEMGHGLAPFTGRTSCVVEGWYSAIRTKT